MPEDFLCRVLRESLADVLEKMFFIRILDDQPSAADPLAEQIASRLSFHGNPSGSLTLQLQRRVARSIAGDFLAAEEQELSDLQVGEVICELTNMICGAVLSRVESTVTFRLASPQLVRPAPAHTGAVVCSVPLGPGAITVAMSTETPICPPAEYAF